MFLQRVREGQLAEPALDRELPGGCGAYEHCCLSRPDLMTSFLSEPAIAHEPPEDDVRVEEEAPAQGRSPRKAAASSGGSSSKSSRMWILPFNLPGRRGPELSSRTSFAIGRPPLAMTTSSPAAARSTYLER